MNDMLGYQTVVNKIQKIQPLKIVSSRPLELVVVSKGRSVDQMISVYEAGACNFGENYLQEAEKKICEFIERVQDISQVNWHFIGKLQSKKIKKLVSLFDVIHSVESWDQIIKIESECAKQNKKLKLFIQVNLVGETTKGGISKEDLGSLPEQDIKNLKWTEIEGFMYFPPASQSPEALRKQFQVMANLVIQYGDITNQCLSMGTSHDFEIAIEEGASHIRVGSLIFQEGI